MDDANLGEVYILALFIGTEGSATQDHLIKDPEYRESKPESENMTWSTVVLETNSEHRHQPSEQGNIHQGGKEDEIQA